MKLFGKVTTISGILTMIFLLCFLSTCLQLFISSYGFCCSLIFFHRRRLMNSWKLQFSFGKYSDRKKLIWAFWLWHLCHLCLFTLSTNLGFVNVSQGVYLLFYWVLDGGGMRNLQGNKKWEVISLQGIYAFMSLC